MSSIADFLIERLENAGVKHIFGLPGDYVLDFYDKLWNNPKIDVVNTTDEAHAGFAADAYARMSGIGCVCVTYNVGALKIANSVACAYAERSPLVVISGSPGMKERNEDILLHHMVRSFNCQKEIFEKITCDAVCLDNPAMAGYLIDRAFENLKHYKQPIYIELPRDVANKPLVYDVYKLGTPTAPKSDPENLNEAIEEVTTWVKKAQNPVIMAGVEVARYGLGEKLLKFAERHNLPIVTEYLSKSVVPENHFLFAGLYSGPASDDFVRKLVDESDCLLMFGVMLTDMTLNFMPAKFQKRQVVSASANGLKVKSHIYANVNFMDFCNTLFKAEICQRAAPELPEYEAVKEFVPEKGKKITVNRLFEMVETMLTKNTAVIADIGDCLFGAADMTMHNGNLFLSPAFYTSMGFAIPGALGVMMAKPHLRPIVLIGDGAFQMSFGELSTLVNRNLNPIVIVLNNGGYSTERVIKDGGYNNLRNWSYHTVGDLFFGGSGAEVRTEEELETAVNKALDSKQLFVLNVVLGQKDISRGMRRMAEALAKRI
jgi:indolepyruvate decarboxylase